MARERGIIVADTKFEFGFAGGELILCDEVMTPDSSRFWPVDQYAPGGAAAVVRQAVRARLARRERLGPRAAGAGAARRVAEQTADRYREAYERITGEPWAAYMERMGAA